MIKKLIRTIQKVLRVGPWKPVRGLHTFHAIETGMGYRENVGVHHKGAWTTRPVGRKVDPREKEIEHLRRLCEIYKLDYDRMMIVMGYKQNPTVKNSTIIAY